MSLLDAFSTEQQNQQSPSYGTIARVTPPTMGEAFATAMAANDRLDGMDVEFQNQHDFVQQRIDTFTAKTGVSIPPAQVTDANAGDLASTYATWLGAARDRMQAEAQTRNDPTLAPPTDQEIAAGGIGLARAAVRRQAELAQAPASIGSVLGGAGAGGYQAATDPLNVISLAVAPEGGALLASALRMGGAMAGQTAIGDALNFGYRQQVNPDYGVGDVAGDVAGAFAGGALFGAGHALGGDGVMAALGAAGGGAALGALQGGGMGALQGAIGGAALPLAGAGFGLGAKTLGMSWRVLRQINPEIAASMPLDVRDAGTIAEKAGDIQAQNPFVGPAGEAAHGEAVGKIESDLIAGRAPELPRSAQIEAAARRGQVFYPGGAIDARYDLAEHADLVTSHDADFAVNPAYPPELQPRDRSGAPARDQVNTISANLEPNRLGPSPEANSGAPIVGPDGVVESGNGRALAIGQAYDQGGGAAARYRAWLEQQGFDTSGFDKPVLVGMRETPMDAGQRADFAHAANGSASLRMSATEQAFSDARLIDASTLDLAKTPDLAASANRDLARSFVAKLPQGERGGMLTRDGGLSAGGVRRMQAALAARAYGDTGVLSRAFDHPDPNIKAIGGALTDAAGPWARMRDAVTNSDIASGHDITRDLLQAVKTVMRARDEGRPAWEVLNQGDMFQSDTTQLATRMFFRDEAMRQPAGRARVTDALTAYADEARKNTIGGRLFADDIAPVDVLRQTSRGLRKDALDLLNGGTETRPADAAEVAQRARLPKEIVDAVDRSATQDGGGDAAGQGARRDRSDGEGASVDDGRRQLDPGSGGGSTGGDLVERSADRYAAQRNAAGDGAKLASPGTALDQAAADVAMIERPVPASGEDLAPRVGLPRQEDRVASSPVDEALALRNAKTGEAAQAQSLASLGDQLRTFDISRDPRADILQRLSHAAVGGRLDKIVGDMKVYTVGPAEMRTLAEGRMKVASGYEPAGFFDPRAGHIVVLDDALRDRGEASRLFLHEGLHGAFMRTINESDSARAVVDHLRATASAAHLDRGGDVADHYGLSNAHEFVSEGFSNPEFQRFLASIPADESIVRAFGLDAAPGNSLWDAFVAAVRKIIGMEQGQHSLLDATMRVGQMLDERRGELAGSDDAIMPSTRLADPGERAAAAEDAARKAKAFADAKDAIAYRINGDRIAQHPNGPLAGYLGILTRDIHEKGGINVESVSQDYEGRMASHMEAIVEPYGSKMSGLKQDIAGIRDVVREIFGVDTGNATAKVAGKAWGSLDAFATAEAKRLGKVFTAAEDWRVPQFWESSRAQRFGKRALMADMQAEIDRGGLKVFDPDTGEEANPLRRAEILNGAADKIVTDASLGGTPGASGSFRTDMRVFRFAEGASGADAYLRLMDKYGAGQGGYLHMLEAHVGKVSRELGLTRVLGPGWADTGEKLLQDALLADKTIRANAERPEGLVDRLKALPGATGRFLMGWLESPAKAEAVWHYMSGQASGVGSELMAGLLSETRAFMTATRMGSAAVTAVPADTVNWLMAAQHNGLDMGRMVSAITDAFLKDNPERREEAARLGITAHAGADAAIGTKRFGDQVVGEKLFARMANFVIRAQGLHAWDSAIRRVFPMEFLGTLAQHSGKAFADVVDQPFGNFLRHYGFNEADWVELSKPEHSLDTGVAKFLHPDNLPEPLRIKLMSGIYDERQFAYLAGGSTRVRAISAQAKAGTLPGELARSVFLFKSFPMSMLATWGMRAAREAGSGRIGTLTTLVTGMTMAGALAMQARSLLQGKDPRDMRDPYFWAESFLQGGAAGIYGDFFKEAFSRSDTSLAETMMGPLAAIPAGIQGLISGARRMAEDGEKVNFGAKAARLLSQNVPGGNLWYSRLIASRLVFDNIQKMIDRDYAASFARQQQRSLKTNHQGFFWAPGQSTPGRAPDVGAAFY